MEADYMPKPQLLSQMREAYAEIELLLASLSPAQMTGPSVYDQLTVKDVLAHLASWLRLEADWLETSLRGEPVQRFAPGYEEDGVNSEANMHRLNEHLYEEHKDRPLEAVLGDFHAAYRRLVAIVESMPEADLNDPQRFAWWSHGPIWRSIAANSYEHFQEHAELIRTGLGKPL